MKKKNKIIIFVLLAALIYIGIRINDWRCEQRMERAKYSGRRYVDIPKQIFDKYTPEEFRDKYPKLFEKYPRLYYSMLTIHKGSLKHSRLMEKMEQEHNEHIFIDLLREQHTFSLKTHDKEKYEEFKKLSTYDKLMESLEK